MEIGRNRELFGSDAAQHLLVSMEQSGSRWLITNITKAEPQKRIASDNEDGSKVSQSVFNSSEYSFSFAYPGDWVQKEI